MQVFEVAHAPMEHFRRAARGPVGEVFPLAETDGVAAQDRIARDQTTKAIAEAEENLARAEAAKQAALDENERKRKRKQCKRAAAALGPLGGEAACLWIDRRFAFPVSGSWSGGGCRGKQPRGDRKAG